jgi:hypothetical protein
MEHARSSHALCRAARVWLEWACEVAPRRAARGGRSDVSHSSFLFFPEADLEEEAFFEEEEAFFEETSRRGFAMTLIGRVVSPKFHERQNFL